MGKTPTSNSTLKNNAAKDDVLYHSQANGDGSFDLALLLANDPGSAKFQSFLTAGVHYNDNGTFSFDDDFSGTSFQYMTRMANGTYSVATVVFGDKLSDVNLLDNFSFEFEQTTTGGAWQSFSELPGWQTIQPSASLEVVSAGYAGIGGDGHWLDTQGSNGPIHIAQSVDVATGAAAKLSFSIAAEDIGGLLTDPNEHLQFVFNGDVVADITQSELGDYNLFHEFSVNVMGKAGADLLEIQSVGANTNVGFALDSVDLHQYILV